MPIPPTDRGRLPDVKAVRKILGLTQRAFADLVGAHPMTVSAWERGTRVPSDHQRALMQLLIDDPSIRERLSLLIAKMEYRP